MRDVINKLCVDLDKPVIQKRISVTQGDTATRTICITLTHGGAVYPLDGVLVAIFKGKKKDGRVLYNDCVIDGNEIRYTITNQTISVVGTVECCIELYDKNGEVLQSPVFIIQVAEPVYPSDTLKSANEYKGIEATVALAEEAKRVSLEAEENVLRKKEEISETYNKYLELYASYVKLEESTTENAQDAKTSCENANKYYNQAKENAEVSEAAKEESVRAEKEAKANEKYCQQSEEATTLAKEKAEEAAISAKEFKLESQNAAEEAKHSAELAVLAREMCESYAEISPEKVEKIETLIVEHTETENPHGITKETVGLGSVENTADADKRVLSASKLQNTVAIGNSSRPVYFNADGVPVAIDYTLQSACTRSATVTISSGNSSLITSGAVYSGLNEKASYEEGTWTPEFFSTGISKRSDSEYTTRIGKYVKIGTLIYLYACVEIGAKTYYCYGFAGLPFWDSYINKYLPMGHIGFIKNSIGEVSNIKRGNFSGYPYGIIPIDNGLDASSTWELQCIIDTNQPV